MIEVIEIITLPVGDDLFFYLRYDFFCVTKLMVNF